MSLTTGGVALVPLAYGAFARADAATRMGAAANLSLSRTPTDREAYDACVAAKADWLSARSDANAFALQALKQAEDQAKPTTEEEKKHEEAKKKQELVRMQAETDKLKEETLKIILERKKLEGKTPEAAAESTPDTLPKPNPGAGKPGK